MRPLIGITPELLQPSDTNLPKYTTNTTYTNAILDSGGLPIILPFSEHFSVNQDLYSHLQGVLLTGGDDIQTATPTLRDTFETQLLEWALDHEIPVLGICRGMQMINLVQGGSLYKDIATERPDALNHSQSRELQAHHEPRHVIHIDPTSQLAQQLDTTSIRINEYHHQAVREVGEDLKATAWTNDGIIEAIEGVGPSYVMGVQCHPESLARGIETRWQRIFNAFTEQCKTMRSNSHAAVRPLMHQAA